MKNIFKVNDTIEINWDRVLSFQKPSWPITGKQVHKIIGIHKNNKIQIYITLPEGLEGQIPWWISSGYAEPLIKKIKLK